MKGLAVVPGLLLPAILFTGCDTGAPPDSNPLLCLANTTPITDIQGDGDTSPLEHTRQVVSGVVTHVEPETGAYLEASTPAEPGRSRAVFIADPELAGKAVPGQRWAVDGHVAEIGSGRDRLTALVRLEASAPCSESEILPLTRTGLPMGNTARETLEGMRVSFGQELFVTDVYSLYRGEVTLSVGAPLRSPTEDAAAGRAAERVARSNRENALDARLAGNTQGLLGIGSRIGELAGVMGHDGRDQLLLVESGTSEGIAIPPAPALPESGRIRVVNANLLNFFNGDGRGGGFPTERGAKTPEAFREQKRRTGAALAALRPDLLAVQELENDGFGPYSAAAALLELLADTGQGDYGVIATDEGRVGPGVITVGLFYRNDTLEPLGPSHTLDSRPFRKLSRQPLAQVFRDKRSGETFLAAVNHLKSKGGCPDDDDANSNRGQGCWNRARVEAVDALLPWLDELAGDAGTDNVLVLGDMNAYRREDPVERFREGGFIELVAHLSGLPQYSYRFFGQAGTLDYAFASPQLAGLARSATIWHINADWPRNMPLPEPWLRNSDHDPVIVDLEFGPEP